MEHRFGPTRAESTLLPQSPVSATQRAPATPPLPRGPGRPLRAPWRVGQPHQRPGRGIRADYQVGYGCGVPHGAPGRREGGLTDVAEKDENLSWRFLCMRRLVTTTGARQTKPRVQIRSFRVSVATDALLVTRLEEECAGPPTGCQYCTCGGGVRGWECAADAYASAGPIPAPSTCVEASGEPPTHQFYPMSDVRMLMHASCTCGVVVDVRVLVLRLVGRFTSYVSQRSRRRAVEWSAASH